jgi:hypothetical protein
VNEGTREEVELLFAVLGSGSNEGLKEAEAAGVDDVAVVLAKAGLLFVAFSLLLEIGLGGNAVSTASSAIGRLVARLRSGSRIAIMPAVTKAKISNIKMMPLDQCSHHDRESVSADSGIGRTTGLGLAAGSKAGNGDNEAAAEEKLRVVLVDEPKGVTANALPARVPATATLLATVPATAPVTAPATWLNTFWPASSLSTLWVCVVGAIGAEVVLATALGGAAGDGVADDGAAPFVSTEADGEPVETSGKRKSTGGSSLESNGICGPPLVVVRRPASRRKLVVVPG